MNIKYFLFYCIFTFTVSQLIQGENKDNCPERCHRCRTGNWSKKLCIHYCSITRWCGITKHHRYTDCTSCNPKQSKLTSSQELSNKDSQSEQTSNTLLKYLFPIIISIVSIFLIIVAVRKYTEFGKKLSCLSPFRYSNLL